VRVCHADYPVVAFDAEVYLRRFGERLLVGSDQQQPGHWLALRGAAAALVFAGAIGVGEAWRVIDDYATVRRLRSGEAGFVHFGAPQGRREVGSLPARTFKTIDQEILVDGIQVLVRDLAITQEGGTLRYRRYLDPLDPGRVSRMYRRGRLSWNAAPPGIVDSGGNRPEVRFGDGGADGRVYVDGELELQGVIAPDAIWLEIDGTRDAVGPDSERAKASQSSSELVSGERLALGLLERVFNRIDQRPTVVQQLLTGTARDDDASHEVNELRDAQRALRGERSG
jgi:hypothetical protein